MVLVYLPTKLGDLFLGQMLGFIFQHHGAFPRPLEKKWAVKGRQLRMVSVGAIMVFMWVEQCHKPTMTGNGFNPTY